jgi:hypothetical protein
VYITSGGVPVAQFGQASGYEDSGQGFIDTRGSLISGNSNISSVGSILHANDYGVGNSNYVSDLGKVFGLIQLRVNCP